jgi:hypothetical protein
MKIARSQCASTQLISHLEEARARLLDLVADLDDGQMTGARLAVVNPCTSGRGLGLPYNSGRIVARTLVRAARGYDACAD